ncbi:hypothetical protein [Polyangium fumosum]|uniref:Uncharacterized protein n=1 Tax=Polyangium fumosum TaxID=889272 RepID=A0A4U1J8H4_9BACT|nr:hypothetical protein [Polyangium fumosum]TKD03527.1 hypothetical protein E8A74_25335 [Polyangium fumosum]
MRSSRILESDLARRRDMRTEVEITVINDRIPGGPETVLGLAKCGPDVAVADEGDYWTDITLDEKDERLPLLLSLLKERGITWIERRRDRFTDEELESARLLAMEYFSPAGSIFAGPRVGTKYDMGKACMRCGAGARQTSAMVVDGQELHVIEGRRAAATCYNDMLVDEKLAGALAQSGATGITFRGVFAAFEGRGHFQLPWRQLCATHTMPPMSPRSTGIEPYKPCTCRRSSFTTPREIPTRLVYRASDLADIRDVNVTWEWFGEVNFNGDVYDSVLPFPLFLVTPKIRRIFRDAGATGFDWIPIRVVDE